MHTNVINVLTLRNKANIHALELYMHTYYTRVMHKLLIVAFRIAAWQIITPY